MVDTSEQKEEFGLVVEADSYTVEDGSEVLAKVGVVGTIAGESDFLRIGEKALLGVSYEGHDFVGEFALEQFDEAADFTGAAFFEIGPFFR